MFTEMDKWFEEKEKEGTFGTYHHTEEKDGEDIYSVSKSDIPEFLDLLREHYTDLAYIQCFVDESGLFFDSKKLEQSTWI